VHGPLDTIESWYAQARVFIVPTRYSAGIPLKAIEAATYGIPLVATPIVAEQLGWERELPASVDPEVFAGWCVRLHTEEALWQAHRRSLLTAVARDFGPVAFTRAVSALLAGD
jgi:glycosyltransferase involved in cell wall biosynthesis